MLVLAWAPTSHISRSALLAKELGIEFRGVHYLQLKPYYAPIRYVLQTFKTLRVLRQDHPDVIFVQNPPIFAALVVYLYCLLSGGKYLIDSHTDALLASWWRWSLPIHRFLSRRAAATIVTNDHLGNMVESWRATAFILDDIPTTFKRGDSFPLDGEFNIVMVSSYSYDEPLAEVVEAASHLPTVHFYITGKPTRAGRTILRSAPSNVHATGLLPFEDYYSLLADVQAVMVLTTEDHTLQWGACEAISVGTPVITSDWPILRQYFHKGTIHVDNTAKGIQEGILRMRAEHERLVREVVELQRERLQEWERKKAELMALIENHR